MINRFLNHFVSCFGFSHTTDFNCSIVHTKLLSFTLPIAAISSILENIIGLHGLTILGFVSLVILELVTGISASLNRGEKLESHKFSRFGLKVFVWMTLLFITNSLQLEYKGNTDLLSLMSAGFFSWLHSTLFIYITLEYLISVLENLGSLTKEKNKQTLITAIINKLNGILGVDRFNGKKEEKEEKKSKK